LTQGKELLNQKEYLKAISILNEAIRINSKNYDAKYYKAIALMDLGSLIEAVKVFLIRFYMN